MLVGSTLIRDDGKEFTIVDFQDVGRLQLDHIVAADGEEDHVTWYRSEIDANLYISRNTGYGYKYYQGNKS